jgi:iron(III) transport system substrate-binding protein
MMGAALLLAACGGDDPTATPTTPPKATPTTAPAAAAPTGFEADWAALQAAAREEGEMQLFASGGFGSVIGEKLLPFFSEKFGIKVVNSSGSSRQEADRVLAERDAGVYSLDVWIGGSGTSTTRLIPGNVLDPVIDLIIHPEILDDSAWWGGNGLIFADTARTHVIGFMGNGGFYPEITFNTDLVNEDEITSFYDILDPKFKGKIIMQDPRLGGTLNTTTFYYVHPKLGDKFLSRLMTEMDPVIVNDARTAAEELALGKYAFCLFSCQREVGKLATEGLPVKNEVSHLLDEGPMITMGSGAIFSVNRPPHPNAQKLFINWFLSKEGQMLMQQANGEDSARLDIPKDDVFPENLRQPGVDYVFPESHPGFVEDQLAAIEYVRGLLASVGK